MPADNVTTTGAFPKFDTTATTTETGAAPAFQFPKFDFGAPAAGGTDEAVPLAFPTFDWNALSKNADIESASDDDSEDEEFAPRGRGRGARGARGGRGRGAGRGRGGRGRFDDSDDDFSDDSDVDHDWSDGDSDEDDEDNEEEDEMEEYASLCLGALETLIAIAKVTENKDSLKDAIKDGISACDTLKKTTDFGDIIVKCKTSLESL